MRHREIGTIIPDIDRESAYARASGVWVAARDAEDIFAE